MNKLKTYQICHRGKQSNLKMVFDCVQNATKENNRNRQVNDKTNELVFSFSREHHPAVFRVSTKKLFPLFVGTDGNINETQSISISSLKHDKHKLT